MSLIRQTFVELKRSGRGGFIPFITAGDPDLATTELLLIKLAKAGADIIELGVPFSDPVADGEVIQRSSERAFRQGGTLDEALNRLARIAEQARGFIYAVSRAGVTGARDEMTRDAETLVKRVRSVSDLPVAVGFGVSTAEQVREVWRFADAAVVGSAIINEIEKLA